ncbi:hypothetical protein [Aquimarina sp. RZ0]|uniref:hypothetical protein n=1 Tax=Aquimarina sp. RZ0 TaxID=2607730 RepID=UPI0011F30718|nr:hypothetical protein [Aquimarina sp. RZ0]KAA1247916.1 hypothetical protein F0000_01470 [Aquimarina sp. RZ0]
MRRLKIRDRSKRNIRERQRRREISNLESDIQKLRRIHAPIRDIRSLERKIEALEIEIGDRVSVQRSDQLALVRAENAQRIRRELRDTALEVYDTVDPFIRMAMEIYPIEEFTRLSDDQRIGFLGGLNSKLPNLQAMIQKNGRGVQIEGNILSQSQLNESFIYLNPDFIGQAVRLFNGQMAQFNFLHASGSPVTLITSPMGVLTDPKTVRGFPVPQLLDSEQTLQQLTIEEVIKETDLSKFMKAQELFQSQIKLMDGLDSSGSEYEFASFFREGKRYSEEEIIPSHQVLASSRKFGKFGLAWKLESDSRNTLELVAPPLVFPRDIKGKNKREEVSGKLVEVLQTVNKGDEPLSLETVMLKLAEAGLGEAWEIKRPELNLVVIKKQKSGDTVYVQENVSMFPTEIGDLLIQKIEGFESSSLEDPMITSLNRMTNSIYKELTQKTGDDPSVAMKRAIAVFARYVVNIAGIPGMLERQATGIRRDSTPTSIKEIHGVWIKTDALNLIKNFFTNKEDLDRFKKVIDGGINPKVFDELVVTNQEKAKFFQQALAQDLSRVGGPGLVSKKEAHFKFLRRKLLNKEINHKEISEVKRLGDKILEINDALSIEEAFNLTGIILKHSNSRLTRGRIELVVAKYKENGRVTPEDMATISTYDPIERIEEFHGIMFGELKSFTQRIQEMDGTREFVPQEEETTAKFLSEVYGDGRGVRKGTRLPAIATSSGNMYVVELR